MGSKRPNLGSQSPILRSERPNLRFDRPDLGSQSLNLRSRRPSSRLWEGGTDGRKPENFPVWNHRSSAPPGPLPKKCIFQVPVELHLDILML